MKPRRAASRSATKPKTQTPASLGYAFPPEWAPHAGTWLSWPRPEGISFPGKYHTVPENLARIVREIARREDVHINVPNDNWQRVVHDQLLAHAVDKKLIQGPSRTIFFHHIKTNECWCRDHGPAFVVRGRPAGRSHAGREARIVDWKFNAWGGKYPPWEDDDAVPTRIGENAKVRVFDAPIVMEGGSVEFNGLGTILTTSQCLLNNNRNPGVSRQRIEAALLDHYGQSHIVWLAEGIEGDDTDGHIDDLARFLNPTTIAIGVEEDRKDKNYAQLRRALAKIESARDQDGRPFHIVEVPMPRPVVHDGQRLPATYMNFHFVNGAVLVPTYRDKARDRLALRILQDQFDDREVVGIDCSELIWGLGAIHCLTQQVPSVPGLREKLRRAAAPAMTL